MAMTHTADTVLEYIYDGAHALTQAVSISGYLMKQ